MNMRSENRNGKRFQTAFTAALAAFVVQVAFARTEAVAANDVNGPAMEARIVEAQAITDQFDAGSETVEVLVNLRLPATNRSNAVLGAAGDFAAQRTTVAAAQTTLMTRMAPGEFMLHHNMENQATMWVSVTRAGLESLRNDPSVESVEPVRILEAHDVQGLALMNAAATRATHGGAGVAIAVCDTGIDYTHPQLGNGGFPNAKVLGGFDFGDNDADPRPNGESHGTACAGIAAGDVANIGDYNGGVAPQAKLYALKISTGNTGSATDAAMIAAWDWCVTHRNDNPNFPIKVISTSFGGGRALGNCDADVPAMATAAQNAMAAGITLLVSSGNEGYCDAMGWPACISGVLSVGAVYDANVGDGMAFVVAPESCTPDKRSDANSPTGYIGVDMTTAADQVTCYSNTSSGLTLFAPSHMAFTTSIRGTGNDATRNFETDFGGTSAACPYAAGAVAALQSAAKATTGQFLTPAQVKQMLTSTGDNVTDHKANITKPRVNLGNAIAGLSGGTPNPNPNPTPEPAPNPVDDAYEPNNTVEQAAQIQAGTFDLKCLDSDIFKLRTTTGRLTVSIQGSTGDLDLYVALTKNGQTVLAKSETESSNEFVEVQVTDGDQFIEVVPYQGQTSDYRMTVSFVPENARVIPEPPSSEIPCSSGMCGVGCQASLMALAVGFMGQRRMRVRRKGLRTWSPRSAAVDSAGGQN